jgi:hypothetical protein
VICAIHLSRLWAREAIDVHGHYVIGDHPMRYVLHAVEREPSFTLVIIAAHAAIAICSSHSMA